MSRAGRILFVTLAVLIGAINTWLVHNMWQEPTLSSLAGALLLLCTFAACTSALLVACARGHRLRRAAFAAAAVLLPVSVVAIPLAAPFFTSACCIR